MRRESGKNVVLLGRVEVVTTAGKHVERTSGRSRAGSRAPLAQKAAIIFRQSIPGLDLSIEEATENVPADGRFYVIDHGTIRRGYRTLRLASALYDRLLTVRRAEAATGVDEVRVETR
jgi:hypothetical protein